MKLLTTITLGLLTTTSLFAQTTMCFKENHPSMTTIESIVLDGGLCSSSKSIQDMKKEGWKVDDIKIDKSSNGNNYIYILKKEDINATPSFDEEKLEQRIMQKLETRKKEELLAKKSKIKQRMSKNGKNIYISTCQQCHGEKAEKTPYNTSRALINLNLTDFQLAIRDYTIGNYDRGYAMIMRPYANSLHTKKVKEVYSYIQTLKPMKDKKEEAK